MADNIAITEGLGTTISTDDCGAAGHTQIIKLAVSNDGQATLIPANSTTGLKVHLAGADVALPPHAIGYTQVQKGATYNTARTGTAVWTPAAGNKVIIQSWQLTMSGTTASDVQLWFGSSGDTTYTRGTDYAIYDGGYTPTTGARDNQMQCGVWISPTDDYVLRITTSAAVTIVINVWGYEV